MLVFDLNNYGSTFNMYQQSNSNQLSVRVWDVGGTIVDSRSTILLIEKYGMVPYPLVARDAVSGARCREWREMP